MVVLKDIILHNFILITIQLVLFTQRFAVTVVTGNAGHVIFLL